MPTLNPPSGLQPCALPYWERLTAGLDVHPCDVWALADWALCWARLNQVEQRLEREGLIVEGYRGNRVKNPLMSVVKDYRDSVLWYAKKFRASPKYRNRR